MGTLDPTLSIRLSAAPFRYTASEISLFFFYSSIVYVVTATPAGWLVDRSPNSPRLYKLITASGFLVLFLTFALLAPFGLSAFGAHGIQADGMQHALNNLPCVGVAMALKGIGSALSQSAIYPDLVLGMPEDEMLQASRPLLPPTWLCHLLSSPVPSPVSLYRARWLHTLFLSWLPFSWHLRFDE